MSEDTDQEIFAQAMADEPGDTPEPAQEQVTEQQPEAEAPPRDEQGRFAAKVDEQEQPPETPEAEPVQEPGPEAQPKQGFVPSGRLREEAERARQAEERATQSERQFQDLQRQVIEMQAQLRQQTAPKEPEKPAPDLWDDPNAWLQHSVGDVLSPVQQQLRDMGEEMSRLRAEARHGADAVEAAMGAMKEATQVKRDPAAIQAHQTMAQSQDPYGQLVEWHKRQQTFSLVGDDPQKWLDAEIAKRMADPAFQAQVIQAARGTAPATVQPSGQVTSPPPSLSKVPGSGNQSEPFDMSDAGIFADAMSGR